MKEDENWEKVKDALNVRMENSENIVLGAYYSDMFFNDIKHISFTISRYKFVSKLMMYKKGISVLELGCQEAIGSIVFEQNTDLEKYVGIDFDHDSMSWNQDNLPRNYIFIEDDFLKCDKIRGQKFDIVLNLDVIEHIDKKFENDFCKVILDHMKDEGGVAVIGTPTIYMTPYASEGSRIGHINLYDQERLYKLTSKYFNNVFIFNMNDEIVHTGFAPMSCYIFAVCIGKK